MSHSFRIRSPLVFLLGMFLASSTHLPALAGGPLSFDPSTVDLHAHLFLYEGVGLDWRGTFTSPLRSTQWSDRLSSRVNADALESSGARIVVVALYSHPLFIGSQRESIRRQIRAVREFLKDHIAWNLVRTPEEARNALARGKRCLILSIEGASGVLETDADLREFVDEAGVRIVTLLHFTDDAFGGTAFLPGVLAISSPFALVRSLLFRHSDPSGIRVNDLGLTDRGRELALKLIQRGVWIDLSHASDRAVEDLLPIFHRSQLPLLYTHTMLRDTYQAERGISAKGLEQVKRSGGIVGLLPSEDMIRNTQVPPELCPAACAAECGAKSGIGLPALLTQYRHIGQVIGFDSITLGSDINAPIQFMRPSCLDAQASQAGFFQYGQLRELWLALDALQMTTIHEHLQRLSSYHFLQVWEKLVPAQSGALKR